LRLTKQHVIKITSCLTKYHVMKAYWEWRYSSSHS